MPKGFASRSGGKGFSDDEMRWIALFEAFFDKKNGLRPLDIGEFPHAIIIRCAKRLNPGEVAGWEWILGHFQRINASLSKSREPLVEFDAFPRTQSDCERIDRWRTANPRG
jgi:hypothetical protein